MANMSNYLETKLLNWLFRGQSFTPPTKIWIALCTEPIDDTVENGDELEEITGGDYERKSIDSATGKWTAPDDNGLIKNTEEVKWEKVTWEGTVKAIALCDAKTAGKVLFWGTLTKEKIVTEEDSVSFAEEALSIQIDN